MSAAILPIEEPFRHLVVGAFRSPKECRRLADELEKDVRRWRHCPGSFYDLWENEESPFEVPALRRLEQEGFFAEVAGFVAESFGRSLSPAVEVSALRMTVGQRLGVHADAPTLGKETHRAMLYLADSGTGFSGGEFLVLNGRSPTGLVRAFRPRAGMLMVFEASSRSFHAVMPIIAGVRQVLSMYFWHVGNAPPVARRVESEVKKALRLAHASERFRALVEALIRHEALPAAVEKRSHRIETAALLHAWGEPEATWAAGLLHGVDGEKGRVQSNASIASVIQGDCGRILDRYEQMQSGETLLQAWATVGSRDPSIDAAVRIWFASRICLRRHSMYDCDSWLAERAAYHGLLEAGARMPEALEAIYP